MRLKSRCQQGQVLLEALKENSFLVSRNFYRALAFLGFWLHHSDIRLQCPSLSPLFQSNLPLLRVLTILLCMRALSLQSCVTLQPTGLYSPPGSSVHRFPRQEHWSGLPSPSLGDCPNPGIEPKSLMSPALAGMVFITEPPWKLKGNCIEPTQIIQYNLSSRDSY